jgi:heme O synthase-like polyprenyltransferase
MVYAVVALICALGFAFHSRRLWLAADDVIVNVSKSNPARGLFFFSIQYLFALFVALLADRLFFLPLL